LSVRSQEDWLTKLVIVRPLGKLDLGDKYGFNPLATLHDRGRNAKTPSASAFLQQIYKGTRGHLEFLKLRIEIRQELVRKTSADSAGEQKPLRALIANEQ
jgi:hypothetical protein